MALTKIRGPGLATPRGRRGLPGEKPEHEINGASVRFRLPNGDWGDWLNLTFIWRGSWATATAFIMGDVVREAGSSYVAVVAHTSAAATQPGVGVNWETVWDLIAEKGATGAAGPDGSLTFATKTDAELFVVVGDDPEFVMTIGLFAADDGGGNIFALSGDGSVEPPDTPDWAKLQLGVGGPWYEMVYVGTVLGPQAGIFSGAVDITATFNELMVWMDGKGGGHLKADLYFASATEAAVIPGSNITLSPQGARGGLALVGTHAGPKMIIGGGTASLEVMDKIKEFHMAVYNSNEPAIALRGIRGFYLDDVTWEGAWELIEVGDPDEVGAAALEVYVTRCSGNMGGGCRSAISLPNCSGGLHLNQFHPEAPETTVVNSAGILLPSTAHQRPDGVHILDSGFGRFDYGMDLQGGMSLWFIIGTMLDRCKTRALRINATNEVYTFKFIGGHMGGQGVGGKGLEISSAVVGFTDVIISHNNIGGWGQGGADLISGDVEFIDNTLADVTMDAANTYDGISLGAVFTGKVDRNKVQLIGSASGSRYGINILSTQANLAVRDNEIKTGVTAKLNNPNRASWATRKIHGNSGQDLEGTTESIMWAGTNILVSQTRALTLDGMANAFYWRSGRRRKVLGFEVSFGAAAVTAGTATFNLEKNGGTIMSATLTVGEQNESVYVPDGFDFVADTDVMTVVQITDGTFAVGAATDVHARVLMGND